MPTIGALSRPTAEESQLDDANTFASDTVVKEDHHTWNDRTPSKKRKLPFEQNDQQDIPTSRKPYR